MRSEALFDPYTQVFKWVVMTAKQQGKVDPGVELVDGERPSAARVAQAAANGGAAGGDGARIKSQLRQVLRKLMEAYFNPLNGAYRSRDGRIAPPRISLSHPLDLEPVRSP